MNMTLPVEEGGTGTRPLCLPDSVECCLMTGIFLGLRLFEQQAHVTTTTVAISIIPNTMEMITYIQIPHMLPAVTMVNTYLGTHIV